MGLGLFPRSFLGSRRWLHYRHQGRLDFSNDASFALYSRRQDTHLHASFHLHLRSEHLEQQGETCQVPLLLSRHPRPRRWTVTGALLWPSRVASSVERRAREGTRRNASCKAHHGEGVARYGPFPQVGGGKPPSREHHPRPFQSRCSNRYAAAAAAAGAGAAGDGPLRDGV